MGKVGAEFLNFRSPSPSAKDLEDIENLDALVMAFHSRAQLALLQTEHMRGEAIALGIGKLAAYCMVDRSGQYWIGSPAIVLPGGLL